MNTQAKMLARIACVCLSWTIAAYAMLRYEYLIAFGDIDNVVGMVPVALALIWPVGATVLLWRPRAIRHTPVVLAAISLFVALSILLFPTALRGNWWVGTIAAEGTEARPDLAQYAPFSSGSLTAKLHSAATLHFASNPPALDGATALYPLYAAFAEAVYSEATFSPEMVQCTNTKGAYEAIIAGERDIIFVASASAGQIAAAQAAGANLVFTPIGREAFVFLVGNHNPLSNITQQHIRNIYSGKTAQWKTLGWPEGGQIIAFQRPEGSGSQTGLQHIMGDIPIQVPQPLPDEALVGTNSLMQQVSVEWNGVQPALGYSYRYYATTMYANLNAKLLAIDGIFPSKLNIQNGSYPFTADFYAVTNGEPQGEVKQLIDWVLSAQGQELVEKTGYTPLQAK